MNASRTSCMEKSSGDVTGHQFFDSWCKTWHELQKQQLKRYIETMESHMRKEHSAMEEVLTHEMSKQFLHMKSLLEESGDRENVLQRFSEESNSVEHAQMTRHPLIADSRLVSQLQSAAYIPETPQEPALVDLGRFHTKGMPPTDSREEVVQEAPADKLTKKSTPIQRETVNEYRCAVGWNPARKKHDPTKLFVAYGPVQNLCSRIAKHKLFGPAVGFVIFSNTILISVEADLSMKNSLRVKRKDTDWATNIDTIYTLAFLVELVVRILAERSGFFLNRDKVGWNILDTVVVVTALVEISIRSLNITFLRGLRVLRLLRILRVMRVFRVFRALRLMVASIVSSALTLISAFILMVTLIFCFALVFVQLLSSYMVSEDTVSPYIHDGLKKYFPGLGWTIYSLMSVISGGFEWEELAELLWEVHPGYMYLFGFYLVFVLFGVLNIMTAVFVESARDVAQYDNEVLIQDKMEQDESLLNQLEQLFIELDNDHSGTISWEEFSAHLEDPRMHAYFSEVGMDIHEAEGLYRLLDVDESGQVVIEEFMIGCMRLKGGAKSIDVASLLYDQKKAVLFEKMNFENLGHQLKSIERHLEMLFVHVKRQDSVLDNLVGDADLSRTGRGELVDKEEPKEIQAPWKRAQASEGLTAGASDSLSL